MKKLLLFSLFTLFIPLTIQAQGDYWQGGIFVGGTAFSGDVNPESTPDLSDLGYSIGLVGRVDITNKIGFRGSLSYGQFKGDDLNYDNVDRQRRGFNFETTIIELVGVAEWEPFAADRYYTDAKGSVVMDKLVSPYLFAGAGLGFANLNTDYSGYNGNNEAFMDLIRQDRAEGNTQMAFVVPFGIGSKFDISNHITLALEFGGRLVFSDYLDGISQSGNPGSNDLYFVSGLMFYYRFFN